MSKYYTIDLTQLIAMLPTSYRKRFNSVILLDTINSTNHYLATKKVVDRRINLCLASAQTEGKGRRGNHWLSPAGGNIYLSISWIPKSSHNAQWYGLAMAFSLAHYLTSLSPYFVGIKWPNDLYCEQRKLGGILVEKIKNKYIVGLGINVISDEIYTSDLPHSYISLQDMGINLSKYCQIVSQIVVQMIDAIDCVANQSAKRMQEIYHPYDLTYGKNVMVLDDGKSFNGTAMGVDDNAMLCLEGASGIKIYDADKVSIKL